MRAVIVTAATDELAEVRRLWETDGIQTQLLTDFEDAYRELSRSLPDLVVLDGSLPGTTRLNLHTVVRTRTGVTRPPVIFSKSSAVPTSCAAPDFYLPLDAGAGAITWLGRCALGLDEDGQVAPETNDARTTPAVPAPGTPRNGRVNGLGAPALSEARPARHWRDRTRSLRGRRRVVAAPGSPGGGRRAMGETSGRDRIQRGASASSDVSLIRFLLRWSWILVIMTTLGAAGGYGYLQFGPLPYQSTATLMLRPQADSTGAPMVAANPERSSLSALALAGQAASPSVYEATARTLAGQLEISTEELANLVLNGQILIVPVGSTSFIAITATDRDPNRAWLLADGYARGFQQDLTAQTRLVSEQQQVAIRAQIGVLQQQLASTPLQFNSPGTVETFSAVHARILQSLMDAQVKLEAVSQLNPPVVRYGETSAPVVGANPIRVLAAGAAVGATLGLIVAYLAELLRQWRRRRALSAQRRAATAKNHPQEPAAAPVAEPGFGHEQPALQYEKEGRPRWAGSARV